MSKARDIEKRINSTRNTRKITKAMGMIASSKIVSARRRILESRPFIDKLEEFIRNISFYSSKFADDRLMKKRKNEKTILVIGVTADRGLCGGYNSNIIRLVKDTIKRIESEGKQAKLDIIGTRGKNHFKFVGYKLSRVYENMSDHPKFLDAREISRRIISRFVVGEIDKVLICYTRFKNTVEQVPVVQQVLPISLLSDLEDEKIEKHQIERVIINDKVCHIAPEFEFEPSPQDILYTLIPEYICTLIYITLLESTASEIGARMTAMRSASDNADEMIKELSIKYHRARQQEITREITEITSGSEALKKVRA